MDNAALQAKLAAILDAFPAKSALHAVDLTTGEVIASLRAETRVVSASTIKVALLFCALEDVMAGKLALDAHISIAPEDFRKDTRVFEPEYRQDGCSLWEMLYWMIVLSDNTATNAVISTLGYEHINAYCARLGLQSTACQRKMLDWTAVREGRNNYTSALDQFRLYEMLYRGEVLNEELRAVAADFLSRVRSFDELQRYIPDAVTLWHKPGGLDHLTHDAGVFFLEGRPYFLGVFTWDGPSMDGQPEQARLIGRVSRLVYDFMKEKRA